MPDTAAPMDVAGADGGSTIYALKTGEYVVESATDVDDKCDLGVGKTAANGGLIGVGFPLAMEVDSLGRTTGAVALGNPSGQPPQPAIGSGPISWNEGTLTSDNTTVAPAPSMCSYRRQTTALLRMTNHYTFELKVTRTQSNAMMCTFTMSCVSRWTWTMSCPTCFPRGARP